jgi:hypothetical protein
MNQEYKIGSEIKVFTKDGNAYEGILMDYQNGYISTVGNLGIILTFPIHSIDGINKIQEVT